MRLNAAWSAIANGIIGLLALLLLLAAVTTRTTWVLSSRVYLLFRAHDTGAILQFLLMLPLALEIGRLSRRNAPSLSRSSVLFGVAAILLVALLLALGSLRVVNDMLDMVPQGCFGAWLCLANLRLQNLLPPWLRYLGLLVGAGLILISTVHPGLATFVYPSMWKIPAVAVEYDLPKICGESDLPCFSLRRIAEWSRYTSALGFGNWVETPWEPGIRSAHIEPSPPKQFLLLEVGIAEVNDH